VFVDFRSSLNVCSARVGTEGGCWTCLYEFYFLSSLELRCAGSSDCGGCWSVLGP
jgi:hypothetical protein